MLIAGFFKICNVHSNLSKYIADFKFEAFIEIIFIKKKYFCNYFFSVGQYDVNITFDGIHIPNSPFKVGAVEPVDASKVKCKGPGVSRGVPASFPAEFTVDATKSGKAPLEVDVTGPGGKVYPCKIKDNGDGTFDCSYLPEKKGLLKN